MSFQHILKVLLISTILLHSIVCQDWFDKDVFGAYDFDGYDGAQLQHIFSQPIHVGDPNSGLNINFGQVYILTIPQTLASVIFVDLTEKQKVAYVDLAQTKVNTGKTQFQLTLRNRDGVNGETTYEYLQYITLLIGSDFEGYSTVEESSFIYGKIGELEVVDPQQDNRVFKFETSDEGSPFDYVPDNNLGQGCGMIRKNGKIIIEEGKCQFSRFYAFVVGYVGEADITGSNQLEISSVVYDGTDFFARPPFAGNTIFRDSPTDDVYGLRLIYSLNPYLLRKVQYSFLHVGIRDFTFFSYPGQAVFPDGFSVLIKSAFEEPLGVFENLDKDKDGQIGFLFPPYLDPFQKIGFYGHIFCGLDVLALPDNQDFFEVEVEFDSFFLNDDETIESDDQSFASTASFACMLLGSRDICQFNVRYLKLVDTDDRIQIESNFGVEPTLDGITTISCFCGPDIDLKFRFLPTIGVRNYARIVLKFDRMTHRDTIFRVEIGFPPLSIDSIVSVTVFGEKILSSRIVFPFLFSGDYFLVSNDLSQNQVVIEYEGVAVPPLQPDFIDSLGIIVDGTENVLDGINCVRSCPEREGLQVGFNFDEPPSCIYCDPTLFQEYSHTALECRCFEHYYLNDDRICLPCQDPFCRRCQQFVCLVCVNYAIENPDGNCQCEQGYYPDNGECPKCPIACTTCSSATDCDAQCLANQNTRGAPDDGCPCLPGFYEDGTNVVCPKCNVECLTCSETAMNCLTCRTSQNFIKMGTTCKCMNGYFLLRTQTTTTCQKCDVTCLTCRVNSYECQSCDATKFRQLNGEKECQCLSGYISFKGECIDSRCNSYVPFCQSCGIDDVGEVNCIDCIDNRIVVGNACECDAGFYEENDECKPCGEGCVECQSATDCRLCAQNAVNNTDGTCSCQDGDYLVQDFQILFCEDCSDKCATCENDDENCLECKRPFLYDDASGQCKCPERTFETASTTCENCLNKCKKCLDGSTCEICDQTYVWNGAMCELNCLEGTYKNGAVCDKCPDTCASCVSKFKCTGCKGGLNLYAGSCRTFCPDGTFALDRVCYRCQPPCKTCSGAQNQCDTCVDNTYFFNGQCLDQCPDKTFYGDKACRPCSPECAKCRGTSETCTDCPPQQHLLFSRCFPVCPGVLIEGVCRAECPPGQFKTTNNECEDCDGKCATCEGTAVSCLRCANGFRSFNGDCVESCPSNLLDTGISCVPCDSSCIGCAGAPALCQRCAGSLIKVNGRCVLGCGNAQFYDASRQNCFPCGNGCSECVSLAQCRRCFDSTLIPVNGECIRQCPVGATNVNDTCVCMIGFLFQNVCITRCPDRFIGINQVCMPCLQPCENCAGSIENCTTCVAGFSLSTDGAGNQRCTRASNCRVGYFEENSICRRLCPNGFYHKRACLPTCPSGFRDNGFFVCVADSSVCLPPTFLKGTSCVDNCGIGFYPNILTRQCSPCITNCDSCAIGDRCTICSANYFPNASGRCVLNLNCGQNQQFQYRDVCVGVCPASTIPNGDRCIEVCPESHAFINGFCRPT